MMKNTLFFIVSTFLIGCGPFVKVTQIDDETTKTLRMEIKYYGSSQLASINYETIQPIEAVSCKNKIWDAAPSQDNAIDQLRYLTKSYGGNGIINIRCSGSEGTTLAKNCWNSVTCTGIAIKVAVDMKSIDNSAGNGLYPARTNSLVEKSARQPAIAEAEGRACMGDDKSRKQTELAALTDAKKKAVEYVSTNIKSETQVINFALEKDFLATNANADVKIVKELEKTWYKDPSYGDCYRVKIRAEIIPY